MLHSIIIPHRNRNRQIYQAIWSIADSAYRSGCCDYEIIVVDHCSRQHPPSPIPIRLVVCEDQRGVLNKPRLYNLGIKAAKGDILSFVDADMLVGPQWIHGTRRVLCAPDSPTRLAYRVRHLKINDQAHLNSDLVLAWLEKLDGSAAQKAILLQGWFADYERFTRAFEAYGQPEDGNKPRVAAPVFGNSQFSIRRDVLGDLRFDEGFVGAGWEDIWMAWAIWKQAGDDYRGEIFTDANHGMLHIWHGPRLEKDAQGSDWFPPGLNAANEQRYYDYRDGRIPCEC
jgi:glycosyltransferase involved in cell wall biosynthesis